MVCSGLRDNCYGVNTALWARDNCYSVNKSSGLETIVMV